MRWWAALAVALALYGLLVWQLIDMSGAAL